MLAAPAIIASIKHLTSDPALGFDYPWLLIGITNSGVSLFCLVLSYFPNFLPGVELSSQTSIPWKYTAPLGLMQGVEVGIGAVLLANLTITMRTEILMLCPGFTFVFSVVAGLETLELRLCMSILLGTVGGVLASYNTMTWEGIKLAPLAILAGLSSTVRWVLMQKWLTPAGWVKPSPISLALRMSPFSGLLGFAVALVLERDGFSALLHLPQLGYASCLLVGISFLICLLVIAEMRVVQLTSALLLGFMVPFHNVIVILLDASNRSMQKISSTNCAGILLCTVATGFYLVARQEAQARAPMALRASMRRPCSYQSTYRASLRAPSEDPEQAQEMSF